MFRSKGLKTAAVLLAAFLTLAACAGPAQKTDTGAANEADKAEGQSADVTEITFWHNWSTGPSGESIARSVEAFNKSRTDIRVKPVYVAADGGDSVTSKLMTAVAGGNPPDVMLASRYGVAEYMDGVTPLNDLAERDNISESMFYKWAWDESVYDGKILGIPYDGTARALFYNKDHFKEAGLDPEKPPVSIAELEEAARKLTVKDGNRISRFGFVPWFGEGWLYTWGWAFGGSFLDTSTGKVTANDPKIVEALEWETNFAKEFGVQDVASFTSSAGTNATNPFMTGQLSMMVSGNWMIAQIAEFNPDLNYGISYIPTPTGTDFTTFVGGRVLIIPKGAKNQEAAWEFIKWMSTSEEGQSIKKITGEFAARPDINEKLYADNPLQDKFIEVLPNGKNRPVILAGNLMWDELAKAPDLVNNNKGTPKEVLDQITDKVNKEIEAKKAQQK
ncbi:MAG TPA: ABC transporter substrate-binding protein [Paenibacillus sp.]|uniref:ABC transporter substrate-binding protein n=1 Tax=Paenibacillus sp. TaxID=58172 RepID=UPI002C7A340D|nr:ABC transporter substrate-binding protein [Paenibacillus sp.]HUC94188.1 ABC transporter substrate-binding protein [Paenibacillus sp.]